MKGYTIQHSIDLLEKAVETGGGSGGGGTAADVSYSNTSSGLVATNVQTAIDEVNTSVGANTSAITTINSKSVKFGTGTHDESISNFSTVDDTYTAPATGIMTIAFTPTGGGSAGRLQVSCGGVQSGVVVSGGYSGFVVIPVNEGDTITILAINNGSVPFIDVRPLEFAAPVSTNSTRKKK